MKSLLTTTVLAAALCACTSSPAYTGEEGEQKPSKVQVHQAELDAFQARLQAAVADGSMTGAEAKAAFEAFRDRLAAETAATADNDAIRAKRAELRVEVDAGRMSEEQAARALIEFMAQLEDSIKVGE